MVVPLFCLLLAAEHSLGYLRKVEYRRTQTQAEDGRVNTTVRVLATVDETRIPEEVRGIKASMHDGCR